MPVIDIVRVADNPHETVHGFRDDTVTRGVDLEGAKITAVYADGTTETLIWHATDPYTNGAATGDNINMSYGYEAHHLSTTKPLASLTIDLQPAYSVFDTNLDSADYPVGASTPGSKNGYPFELDPPNQALNGDLTVTYSGIVNLKGSAAVGDVYTTMTIDFSQFPGGGLLGDLYWKSDMDTMDDPGDLVPVGVTCLVRGTLIATDRGLVPVENLTAGCKVLTRDNGYQPLVMTMSRVVGAVELQRNAKLYPVHITAGALGAGLPQRDLIVSRQHRMVANSNIVKRMFGADAALIAAIRLTDLPGIYVDDSVENVEYFHLIFEKHEVIFAEGAPTESFLMNSETRLTLSKAQREEFSSLFPELGTEASEYMIPSRVLQKELVRRHVKNEKSLLHI